jgi:Sulfotransferase domain
MRLGRNHAALEANRAALAAAPEDFGLHVQQAWIGARLQDPTTAHLAFQDAWQASQTVDHLASLLPLASAIFEGWPRTQTWLSLQDRLARLAPEGDASAAVIALRLKLALRDVEGFLALLDRTMDDPAVPLLQNLRRVGAMLRAPRFPDFDREKVFGVGLSKTGTTSLARALDRLGFHAMHYTNALTGEVLRVEDAFLFDALVDTPVCAVFETLYRLFPRALFVLSVRDPTAWETSFAAHNRAHNDAADPGALVDSLASRGGAHRLERALIYAGLYRGHPDAGAARQGWESRVRGFFAAHDPARLLVMDIPGGDGWSTLCPFLGRPVPDEPFPWENRTPTAGDSE